MQKLIYVPPGNVLGRNNNIVLTAADKYILSTISGISGIDVTLVTSELVGIDGEYVHFVRTEAREIPCTVYVKGDTRQDMYANRFKLINAFAPSNSPGTVYYSNDYITVQLDVYPILPPDFTERVQNYNKCDIKLYAPQPYWQATNENTENIAYQQGHGFTLPFKMYSDKSKTELVFSSIKNSVQINNDSNTPCGVNIVIVAETDIDSASIANVTTGEKITITKYIPQGCRLLINTANGSKSVTLQNGAVSEDAFQYISVDSVFWQLQPGINNIRYITDNEEEKVRVSISYRPLFVGV